MYWKPYVSVAKRHAIAAREMQKLQKKGMKIEPVEIENHNITHTFWGTAWCEHLEQFSDFSNRLPRGRTYVRNGSVCHLSVKKGKVEAIVSGSELYNVSIQIAALSSTKWESVRQQCAGQIGSMLELLQGQLSSRVMKIVTDPSKGLFPEPDDIKLHCDCPDWAYMCKHVAAVLYGIGARLDESPELLFLLRKVDHQELISSELDMQAATTGTGNRRRLATQDLSDVFGIDIEDSTPPLKTRTTAPGNRARPSNNKKSIRPKGVAAGGKSPSGNPDKPVAKKAPAPNGATVARLREEYGMSCSEFAGMLGVSPQSIMKWESTSDELKLQERSLKVLSQAWLRKWAE